MYPTKKPTKHYRAKKSLGQNFLRSTGALNAIIEAGELKKEECVLEIGPGKGALTEKLLQSGAIVVAVEKDVELCIYLTKRFETEIKRKQLHVIQGDILEIPIKTIIKNKSYKVIANIPYYITGALIRLLLENSKKPTMLVLLVQKEVAERIVTRDNKESILSLSVKYFGVPKYIEKVPRKAFTPIPNVDSAILKITVNGEKISDEESGEFFKILHKGFGQKRKVLRKNLEGLLSKERIERFWIKHTLNKDVRAEDVPLVIWKLLVKEL